MQKQLDVLVEVSRRLQECAEAGDWEAVNHLQEKCQQLAGELFAEVIAAADVQAPVDQSCRAATHSGRSEHSLM